MPPITALQQLAKLVQCQIEYLLTVCSPGATLPDFLSIGCLEKREDGSTFYNLGPDSHVDNKEQLLKIPESELEMKIQELTQSKRTRKSCKRQHDSTPQKEKQSKRQPMMSTPR